LVVNFGCRGASCFAYEISIRGFLVKKKFSLLFSQSFVTLFVLALVIPGLVFAQQKPQGSSSTDRRP